MTALKLEQLLQAAGHDLATAQEEGLGGAPDDALLAAAIGEDRALVTLDLDFADVRRHDPARTAGIIVLRLHDQTLPMIRRAVMRPGDILKRETTAGRLWTFDESRLCIWIGESGAP